jgi:hypothetical protein
MKDGQPTLILILGGGFGGVYTRGAIKVFCEVADFADGT